MKSAYQNELDVIVRVIADTSLVIKTILFGSLAHDMESTDSDYEYEL